MFESIDDKSRIKALWPEIYDVIDYGYTHSAELTEANHGIPQHCIGLAKTPKESKKYECVKVTFNSNNDIVAASVYQKLPVGLKCTGMGAKNTYPEYKDGLKTIIAHDVEHRMEWYWVEASNAIERYFLQEMLKQNVQLQIPSALVPEIMGDRLKQFNILDDFYYERQIGDDVENIVKKTIFGFCSPEIYQKAIALLEQNHQNLVLHEDDKKRTFAYSNTYTKNHDTDYKWAYSVIDSFDILIGESEIYETPPEWRDSLAEAIAILAQYSDKDSQKLVEYGELFYEQTTDLELHKLRFQ